MNYKVGDTVVCIDATPQIGKHAAALVLGERYTVAELHDCGATKSVSVGLRMPDGASMTCRRCGYTTSLEFHLTYRFIKLDGLTVTTEEEATA